MKAFSIQVRREFWEHRSLWLAPLAVALLLVAGATIFGLVRVDLWTPGRGDNVGMQPGPQLFEMMLFSWGVPFWLTVSILVSVYLLDCLYGERRDRSILFWKSLPVSDTRTVLTKFVVGLVIVPLATFLLVAATSIIISVIGMVRFRNVPMLQDLFRWNTVSWLHTQGAMLYGLIATLLWYAPYAAYMMLASAWARRAVYAWAVIPPLLAMLVERMVFGTNYIGAIVQRGFGEVVRLVFNVNSQFFGMPGPERMPRGPGRFLLQPLNPSALISSPQLWLGLFAAALMLALAIRIRRHRDDS